MNDYPAQAPQGEFYMFQRVVDTVPSQVDKNLAQILIRLSKKQYDTR